MSGPKVVRIVTHEEIVAICEGHLARLNAAADEWVRIGRRNGLLTDAEISATLSRREALRSLLAQGRFMELQKAVPDEISFLQADQEARLSGAAMEMAKARAARSRTEAVATSVLKALERRGEFVPADLRVALEDAAAGRSDGEAAISRAFTLLSSEKNTVISDNQRRLADALKETDDRQSFAQWLATQAGGVEDEGSTRLYFRIAELAVILGEGATTEFEERLRRISASEPSSRRALLIDSLEVDLAQAVTKAKERATVQSRLRMLAAELSQMGTESLAVIARTIEARVDDPFEALIALEEEATSALNHSREEVAAQAKRLAMLKGLAALGYQVSEGLETAWARDGKVIIKRASQPDYGVEIGGRSDSGRVQMRTVAFRNAGTPADESRDRDAETIFCGDVTKLQTRFAETGGEIVIERALPVSAAPLRVVAETSDDRSESARERAPDKIRRI
jgi:hypothetical protein